MKPPVLDVTGLTARRAIQTQNRVIVSLDGDRLLQARQNLLRLSQRQAQFGDIAEVTQRPDIYDVDNPCGLSISVSTKRKTHAIHEPPTANRFASHTACALIPPHSGHSQAACPALTE
jgi:hypothetical protein